MSLSEWWSPESSFPRFQSWSGPCAVAMKIAYHRPSFIFPPSFGTKLKDNWLKLRKWILQRRCVNTSSSVKLIFSQGNSYGWSLLELLARFFARYVYHYWKGIVTESFRGFYHGGKKSNSILAWQSVHTFKTQLRRKKAVRNSGRSEKSPST